MHHDGTPLVEVGSPEGQDSWTILFLDLNETFVGSKSPQRLTYPCSGTCCPTKVHRGQERDLGTDDTGSSRVVPVTRTLSAPDPVHSPTSPPTPGRTPPPLVPRILPPPCSGVQGRIDTCGDLLFSPGNPTSGLESLESRRSSYARHSSTRTFPPAKRRVPHPSPPRTDPDLGRCIRVHGPERGPLKVPSFECQSSKDPEPRSVTLTPYTVVCEGPNLGSGR